MGVDAFRERVEQEWADLRDGPTTLTDAEMERAKTYFTRPHYRSLPVDADNADLQAQLADNRDFERWYQRNTLPHRVDGYRIVNLSLKATGYAPGDISDTQMEAVADLADAYSFGEVRTTHQQNMVLADVAGDHLFTLWEALSGLGLATPNIGYLTDLICCPGGDYCSLANAKSIPVADAIRERFDDLDYLYDLGPIELNISGCMNACGHHHIGHIGILGVDKKGGEAPAADIGLQLEPGEAPADIAGDLHAIPVVAINFPVFTDGRGFSYARELRQLGYSGEIRAVGGFIRDQLAYLARCGVNAFEFDADVDLDAAVPSLQGFTDHYQADVLQSEPLFRRR